MYFGGDGLANRMSDDEDYHAENQYDYREPELKPCPFCGGDAYYYTSCDDTGFDVGCKTDNCIMRSGSDIQYGTQEGAARGWNKRAESK